MPEKKGERRRRNFVATSAARRANFTQSWMCEKFSTPLPPRHRFRRRVIMLERSAGDEAKDAAERCSGKSQKSFSLQQSHDEQRQECGVLACSPTPSIPQRRSLSDTFPPLPPAVIEFKDLAPFRLFAWNYIQIPVNLSLSSSQKTKKTFVLVSTLGRDFSSPVQSRR